MFVYSNIVYHILFMTVTLLDGSVLLLFATLYTYRLKIFQFIQEGPFEVLDHFDSVLFPDGKLQEKVIRWEIFKKKTRKTGTGCMNKIRISEGK